MVIGYEAKRAFHNFTGLGNYARTLLKNMAINYPDNRYLLFSPTISNKSETQFFFEKSPFDLITPQSKNWTNLLWRLFFLKNEITKRKADIFHGLSNELPIGLKQKSVVTIHDLIFKSRPEEYPLTDRLIYDFKFKKSAFQADLVIAISQATKNHLLDSYNLPEEKIRILYQSCNPTFYQNISLPEKEHFLTKYALPDNFLLYIGSIIPRKNLLNLVKAIEILPPELKLPLVVIGNGKTYKNQVKEYVEKKKLSDLILWRQIPYGEFPLLYQTAYIFIYPSFQEGFGIPVLEALASGTPVVTSKFSSLPEAGGPDSVYIDPHSPEEISFGIQNLLEDKLFRKRVVEMGKEYAKKFHGKLLSDQLMAIYRDIA